MVKQIAFFCPDNFCQNVVARNKNKKVQGGPKVGIQFHTLYLHLHF